MALLAICRYDLFMVLSIYTSPCTPTETYNLPIVNATRQKDDYIISTILQTKWLQLCTEQIFTEKFSSILKTIKSFARETSCIFLLHIYSYYSTLLLYSMHNFHEFCDIQL